MPGRRGLCALLIRFGLCALGLVRAGAGDPDGAIRPPPEPAARIAAQEVGIAGLVTDFVRGSAPAVAGSLQAGERAGAPVGHPEHVARGDEQFADETDRGGGDDGLPLPLRIPPRQPVFIAHPELLIGVFGEGDSLQVVARQRLGEETPGAGAAAEFKETAGIFAANPHAAGGVANEQTVGIEGVARVKLFERGSPGINPDKAPLHRREPVTAEAVIEHRPNVENRQIRQADPLPGGGGETGDAVAPKSQQREAGVVSRARIGPERFDARGGAIRPGLPGFVPPGESQMVIGADPAGGLVHEKLAGVAHGLGGPGGDAWRRELRTDPPGAAGRREEEVRQHGGGPLTRGDSGQQWASRPVVDGHGLRLADERSAAIGGHRTELPRAQEPEPVPPQGEGSGRRGRRMNRYDLSVGGAQGELVVIDGPESARGALPGGNRLAVDHPPGTVREVRQTGGSADPDVADRGIEEGGLGEGMRGESMVAHAVEAKDALLGGNPDHARVADGSIEDPQRFSGGELLKPVRTGGRLSREGSRQGEADQESDRGKRTKRHHAE